MYISRKKLQFLFKGRDRRGAAIVTFPSMGRRDKAKPEDYRLLLQYLMSIPRYIVLYFAVHWIEQCRFLKKIVNFSS